MKFTKEQIELLREAFFKAFHKQGEVFFDYLEDEEGNIESTMNKFNWLLEELDYEE